MAGQNCRRDSSFRRIDKGLSNPHVARIPLFRCNTFKSIPSIRSAFPLKCTTTPECTFCIMQCSGRNRTVSPTSCPSSPRRRRRPPVKCRCPLARVAMTFKHLLNSSYYRETYTFPMNDDNSVSLSIKTKRAKCF